MILVKPYLVVLSVFCVVFRAECHLVKKTFLVFEVADLVHASQVDPSGWFTSWVVYL